MQAVHKAEALGKEKRGTVAGRVKAARLPNLPGVIVQDNPWTSTRGKFGSLAALTLPATGTVAV